MTANDDDDFYKNKMKDIHRILIYNYKSLVRLNMDITQSKCQEMDVNELSQRRWEIDDIIEVLRNLKGKMYHIYPEDRNTCTMY